MTIQTGKSAKDSKYLRRIKDAIEGDSAHPRNNGIKMQAHHLISAEGMNRSGLAKKIEKFGYDINLLPNLVFIPCTLQGACHLGIQPHRGNHDAFIDQDNYEDDMEPRTYHEMVSNEIKALKQFLSLECKGDETDKSEKIISELDRLSRKILNLIQMKPVLAPLTSIALHFGKNGVGCGGVDSVSAHQGDRTCPVGRNHRYDPTVAEKSQGAGQNIEKITFSNSERYRLKVGR